jgi:hypothetical protein
MRALLLLALLLAGCAERPIRLEPPKGHAGWSSMLACPECKWKTADGGGS